MSRNMRFNYLKKKKNSIWKCLLMVIWYLTQEYKQAFFMFMIFSECRNDLTKHFLRIFERIPGYKNK